MGTIYRNGQYYGGSSGGATAELDRHEIGYGNDESNIVGSGLFTKKNANIVEDLCEEQQSNSLEFIIDSTTDGDMPAGTITISNGTLETDYDSTQYVKDYEGHGYIGPILYQVTSGQNYGIKFSFETFNKVLADKDYYLSFVGYEDYANLSFHKTVESVKESGVTVYNVTCTANTKDAFEGQIVFPPTTGQDLAIYNGNADQDGGKFFLKNKGILCIGGNNLTALDGNTRFTMHDSAKMDLTGGWNRPDAGPEIYMHGNAMISVDDMVYAIGDDEEYKPYVKYNYIVYRAPKDSEFDNLEDFLDYLNKTSLYRLKQDKPSYCYWYYQDGIWKSSTSIPTAQWRILSAESFEKTTYKDTMGVESSYNEENYTYWKITNVKEIVTSQTVSFYDNAYRKGPVVNLQGKPYASLYGNPIIKFSDNARFQIGGNSDISVDGGIFHANGSSNEVTFNPEGNYNRFHFNARYCDNEVNLNGCNIIIGPIGTETSQIRRPEIQIFENSRLLIGGSNENKNAYILRDGTTTKNRNGVDVATLYLRGNGYLSAQDYSSLYMHDSSSIMMNGMSIIEGQNESYFYMDGSSSIRFQDSSHTPYSDGGGKYYAYGIHSPSLMADQNRFTFAAMGNGPTGITSVGLKRYGPWDSQYEDDDHSSVKAYKDYSPYFGKTYSGGAAERLVNKFINLSPTYNPDYSMQIGISTMKISSSCISKESYEAYVEYLKGTDLIASWQNNLLRPFSPRYLLKKDKMQEYYNITKDKNICYYNNLPADINTKIVDAGYSIEDLFDYIVTIDTSNQYYSYWNYVYTNDGWKYGRYGYYYWPQKETSFSYIEYFNQSYITQLNYFISKLPDLKNDINYITADDNTIICHSVNDWTNLYNVPNYYREWNCEYLFDMTYDSDGNVLTRKLKQNIVNDYSQEYYRHTGEVGGYTLVFGGNTRTVIESQNGKAYINIGAQSSSDSLNINIHGSSFINTTGHSHIEAHDDSTLVMRGGMGKRTDGTYRPAWLDGKKGWKRPVPTRENGPGVGYYDKSTFVMRGRWNTEATIAEKTSVFTFYDLEEFPTSVEDFTVEMQDAYNKELEKDGWYYVEGGTVTYVNKGNDEYLVTITNATVTDRPHNWSEHPSKQEDSPLVEIIEDSILQMYGSSHLRMDDDEIIFGNADGSVSFTIEELNNLKNGSGGGAGEDNPPYELPIASETELGGVKIGEGINIAGDGTISVEIPEGSEPYELPAATNTTLGGVKVGKGLSINGNGVLSANAQELTPATEETLGGVKIGKGLTVDGEGLLSVNDSAAIGLEEGDGIEINEIESSDLTGLPEGYSKISYIDNKAKSWILLDYIPNENTRVEVDFSINTGMGDSDSALFGSRNGSTSGSRQFVFWVSITSSTGGYYGFVYGGNTWSDVAKGGYPTTSEPIGYEQIIHANVSKDGVYVNNEKIHDVNAIGTPSPYKMAVFACAIDNTGSTSHSPGDYKVYSMKIYEGEELKLDLVPALNSKKQAGLYDKINNNMYTSMNSTNFVYNENSVIENTKKYSVGIKYDSNALTINENNELTVIEKELPTASPETLGGVKVSESAGVQVNENGELDLKIKIVPCTQEQYDALEVKDPNTLYLIGD